MNILCVIPVRGGSKGIHRKNVREIAGKPLVAWTIEQALAARPAMDVLVSTDDPEIAEVARDCGAAVPFLRPSMLAEDTTATEPVILHAIDFRTGQGRRPDAVMLLQATSPLRLPGTVDRAIKEFEASLVDSMVGVVPQTPFLWRIAASADPGSMNPVPEYPVDARPRRQDLDGKDFFYRETGSLYLTKTEVYLAKANRLGGRIGLFIMDEVEGTDVDTEVDWLNAAAMLHSISPSSGQVMK
ncbi:MULTISPECIES: acylneuraminate cytidylyltransferase family protein [Arthrobacter]|uniref:Acylneuraminate cytidylyltransferase family protein n=2 Tax=Arthrobacter TaxID=1663 RepID=A0ABU9KLD8_9MICC|nr:acylneuraminate cytidylyltransferase family protein [Arthrobacter sp. YJM1]MDP5227721.1 acylneuraminate cytidylyltransferase family protein [Arthrobacter sp. YJM1]